MSQNGNVSRVEMDLATLTEQNRKQISLETDEHEKVSVIAWRG